MLIIVLTKRGRACSSQNWAWAQLLSKMAPCLHQELSFLQGTLALQFPPPPARGWILSNARPSGQERRAPNGCRGIILVQMALRKQGEPPQHSWWLEGCPWSPKQVLTLKMQGRLEEQLPSLRMASVGGCGKTTSGLPPITVSLHDSRSLHGSIRCLLDGVSKHSRTLWEDGAYLLLCLLETQLPAMWRFETGGCNLFCGYPR